MQRWQPWQNTLWTNGADIVHSTLQSPADCTPPQPAFHAQEVWSVHMQRQSKLSCATPGSLTQPPCQLLSQCMPRPIIVGGQHDACGLVPHPTAVPQVAVLDISFLHGTGAGMVSARASLPAVDTSVEMRGSGVTAPHLLQGRDKEGCSQCAASWQGRAWPDLPRPAWLQTHGALPAMRPGHTQSYGPHLGGQLPLLDLAGSAIRHGYHVEQPCLLQGQLVHLTCRQAGSVVREPTAEHQSVPEGRCGST